MKSNSLPRLNADHPLGDGCAGSRAVTTAAGSNIEFVAEFPQVSRQRHCGGSSAVASDVVADFFEELN
jgi:hypothetical protein